MKKLCIFLILIALLVVSAGCAPKEQDSDKDLGIPEMGTDHADRSEYFSNFDEFKNYISNKASQSKWCPIDDGVYVDLSSIIPNSQIKQIAAKFHNWYSVRYAVKNNTTFYGLSVDFITTPTREKYDYNVEEMIKSGALNETPIKSMSELKDYKATTAYTWVEIGEYTLFYPFNTSYDFHEPDNGHKFNNFTVLIDDYNINIQWNEKLSIDDYTPEQSEFLSALVPQYGATDDSVTAMLDRIKALIPSGNISEDSYDYALDGANGDASGTVSSNDGSSTTDQTSGETNEDTDYGDDYLYEDNNIPTIPGISPDWKPNANGKYPLKDGYTKYELTLILACEIELDFGDMTDEEISKLEFRLIEEDTED